MPIIIKTQKKVNLIGVAKPGASQASRQVTEDTFRRCLRRPKAAKQKVPTGALDRLLAKHQRQQAQRPTEKPFINFEKLKSWYK